MREEKFQEYNVVRVVFLSEPTRYIMGSRELLRQPEVGDIGTIVDIPQAQQGLKQVYIVESVDSEGRAIWLADFYEEELELVQTFHNTAR